jgi:hypothetical protein
MKIISKWKDYYDYLQGIYGVDDKLVLDRRNFHHTPEILTTTTNVVRFYIAGKVIEGYWKDNKIYYGSKIKQFAKNDYKVPSYLKGKNEQWYIDMPVLGKRNETIAINKFIEEDIHNYNIKTNCPILLEAGDGNIKFEEKYSRNRFSSFPKLVDFDLGSFISAHDMWIMLSSFLSSQIKDAVPNPEQTNKEKILAKGFDIKTSFRPNIKKKGV